MIVSGHTIVKARMAFDPSSITWPQGLSSVGPYIPTSSELHLKGNASYFKKPLNGTAASTLTLLLRVYKSLVIVNWARLLQECPSPMSHFRDVLSENPKFVTVTQTLENQNSIYSHHLRINFYLTSIDIVNPS